MPRPAEKQVGRIVGTTGPDETNYKVFSTETDGSGRAALVLKNGSSFPNWAGEATGEARVMLTGKDSGGNIDELRTNSNQQLQVEVVKNIVQVDAIILTTSLAAVFDPGSTASEQYEVYVYFTNYTSSAATVDLAVDIGGGTTADRFILNDKTVPANATTRWFGPIGINGDDDVIATASANTTIVAWPRVVRIV